ncbi:MAG: hypothetical protein COB38_04290 [Gammaproteobacteria bacterium]|nr:MAG: hypothetical protein COB38_04290 [Gammaproteobacteria bacterium]
MDIDIIEENKKNNVILTSELHFELLKQYAWLSSTAIGGLVLLAQLDAIPIGKDLFISLGFFVVSIFSALFGQEHQVDSLLKGKDVYEVSKTLTLLRVTSMGSLGTGVGYFGAGFILT